jgi:hypothetical protein
MCTGLSGLRQGLVVGHFQCGNRLPGFMKGVECVH